MIGATNPSRLRLAQACRPFMSGRSRSIRIRSGLVFSARATPSFAVAASVAAKPSASSCSRNSARRSSSSSMIRMVFLCAMPGNMHLRLPRANRRPSRAPMNFEVRPDGVLLLAGAIVRCALGRGGVIAAAAKREGDGATPAGLWPLRRVLYRPDRGPPPDTRDRVRSALALRWLVRRSLGCRLQSAGAAAVCRAVGGAVAGRRSLRCDRGAGLQR